jgi:hypothetical protein
VCIANEDLDLTLKQSKEIEMMQFNNEFTAVNTHLFLPWSPCCARCCVIHYICKQYAETSLLARKLKKFNFNETSSSCEATGCFVTTFPSLYVFFDRL